MHRGRVVSDTTAQCFTEIQAEVPLSELIATFSGITASPMKFVGYQRVDDNNLSDESGSGVTANRPDGPTPSRRSEKTRPEPADE